MQEPSPKPYTGLDPEQIASARALVDSLTISSEVSAPRTQPGALDPAVEAGRAALAGLTISGRTVRERAEDDAGAKELRARADDILMSLKTPDEASRLNTEHNSLSPAARGEGVSAQQQLQARERQREISTELRRSMFKTEDPDQLGKMMLLLGFPQARVDNYVARARQYKAAHPTAITHVTFALDPSGKMVQDPMLGLFH